MKKRKEEAEGETRRGSERKREKEREIYYRVLTILGSTLLTLL